MTTPESDRNPLAVAREVLEREERLAAYSHSVPLEARASWDATRSEQVKAAPDLARAVIAVEAVVEAFAYAATLDRGLSEWEGMCDHFVKKCHAALEGDPR